MKDKIKKHLRPDHQFFDEVRVITVPRYKQSELSGDEWRISAEIQYMCKGKIMGTAMYRDVETALDFVKSEYWKLTDMGRDDIPHTQILCDQEGCSNASTVTYKVKNQYNKDGDIKKYQFAQHRTFCEIHKRRGDCGLEDADDNYIKLD